MSKNMMFDLSQFQGFSEGDNVACYDEKTRVLMCFFITKRKGELVPVPLLTRHRKPDEILYIHDDDILIVKKEDGQSLCDIDDYPGIMRDSDVEEEEDNTEYEDQ